MIQSEQDTETAKTEADRVKAVIAVYQARVQMARARYAERLKQLSSAR